MARHRKLLLVSPIGLAVVMLAFYSQQLVDWSSEQIQPVHIFTEPGRVEENQVSNQNTPVDENQPSSQSFVIDSGNQNSISVDAQFITEGSQNIATPIDSITLSGWVGTEYGENFAGETVILYSSTLRAHYSMKINSSGEFIFTDLKPSYDYALKVSPQGMFKRYTQFPIKLESEQERRNIILESIPLGILNGRIVDPYGRSVSGIELFIKSVEVDYWSTTVISDANGTFSVTGFPQGRFQVDIKGKQSVKATGLRFDPTNSETVSLTIDLGPYDLWVRIYDNSGQSIHSAIASLTWRYQENSVRFQSTRSSKSDANGEIRFTGLGPGDHELAVYAWKEVTSGQTDKQTIRQTVNVGVDPGKLNIYFNFQSKLQ